MDFFEIGRWSPYTAGIGIGILSWLTFILSDKPIGCSTAFARTSGMIERLFKGRKVLEKAYYQEFVPKVDWEWMLVLGIIFGSFTSAKLSGQFNLTWVPASWTAAFGSQPFIRIAAALLGGIMLGFGARWAGGCTSGHGISGTLQLAVSSWLAAICFFIGGIAAAFFIFHVLA